MSDETVKLGCEVLVEQCPSWLRSARLGLLANQASVSRSLEHVVTLVRRTGARISCLFSPQHGFYAEKQANMIESEDDWDAALAVPVYSLYGGVRQPTREMLQGIDVLLIDLQDVGTRVYTYGTTMGLCLEAAAEVGVKVVILDRPNPIGGVHVEGNVLEPDYRSFVGRYPIPMRHGLTMGELARYVVSICNLPCDLEVVPLEGWKRRDFFPETLLPWVFPSPNMPGWETALLYPGMVLLEGTNISEGRGTTLPFQLFGAPFLDQQSILQRVARENLDGVVFRPVCFEPMFDKWQGKLCYGFQIHITDHAKVRPYRLGLALLKAFYHVHGDQFLWLPPPYEYEWEKLPMEILLGNGTLRERLQEGMGLPELEAQWKAELEAYEEKREGCLLYGGCF